jgi:hypothetical protein
MFGASAGTGSPEPGFLADHVPTLAPAPAGLSVRRVERWLDLPTGAWHRRRLFALRVNGRLYEHLGFRDGDLAIVEPGPCDKPGRLVVTRGTHGTSICRTAARPAERPTTTAVLELPLREKRQTTREHVVGVVIGILRATGTGALRPVSLPAAHPAKQKRGGRRASAAPSRRSGDQAELQSTIEMEQLRRQWRDWRARPGAHDSSAGAAARRERWKRLEASLSTLCDCLAHTSSPGLRQALAEQVRSVAGVMRREMGR